MAFGEGPLRLPLLVEAAEELFEPVVIRNNVAGYEHDVLARYEEPAWNNPVVRFVGADGKDLIPRKDGVWKTGPLLARLEAALLAAQRPVPRWLRTVTNETSRRPVEKAVFSMW